MAYISVENTGLQDSAEITDTGDHQYEIHYQVITDDPMDGLITAMVAVPIAYGDELSADPGVYVHGKNGRCVDRGINGSQFLKKWEIVVSYKSGQPENAIAPWNRPTKMNAKGNLAPEPVEEDVNGKALLNAAGLPFQDQQFIDLPSGVRTFTKSFQNFDWSLTWLYNNCLNNSAYLGADARTIRVNDCSAESEEDDTWGPFVTATLEVEFRPGLWRKKIMNTGTKELDNGKLKNILVNGVPVTEGYPLDKNGKAIPEGQGIPPVYLQFDLMNECDFSVFDPFFT